MYYVYILKSEVDGNLYIGSTENLKRRLYEHNRGLTKSIRNRIPFKLICYEAYADKETSQRREKYLKSSDGHKDIKRRLVI